MNRTPCIKLLATAIALSLAVASQAANLAVDNASAFAYLDDWQTGDNGGFGWQQWTLETTDPAAGFFVSSSITNGNGADDGQIGGLSGDSDIDTIEGPDLTPTTPVSWGMFAQTFTRAEATRAFTGGPLGVGQSVMIDFDNGFVNPFGLVGISLLNPGGDTLWQLQYAFGDDFYSITDALGNRDTSVNFGTEGLGLTLTRPLIDPAFYEMSLVRRDGESDVLIGLLNDNADQGIAQIRFFADGPAFDGTDTSSDFFINNMAVIPEPSSAMLTLAALGLSFCRRHRYGSFAK